MHWIVRVSFIAVVAAVALADDNEMERVFKQSNDQFTANMFSKVVENSPDKSVVISPFSVLPLLGQLVVASEGDTRDEILKVIGFPNDNVTKEANLHINTKLRSAKGVVLKMANRIYVADDAELNDEYAAVSRDVFDSDVKSVDFTASKRTAGEINAWVEERTNHRIKDLVNPEHLTSFTRAVLANAIYFKGNWKIIFEKHSTRDMDFHVSNEKTTKVPTMEASREFVYGEIAELDAKILQIPYEGDETSMIIILPNKVDGITDLIERLKNPSALSRALEQAKAHEVYITLPKFKIETTTDLKDILQKMNVNVLFTSDATLNHLLKNEYELYVTKARQKAFIEVNEDGTEAAAANYFVVGDRSETDEPHGIFEANHPFVFTLRWRTIDLFIGKVTF